jgi:hypothetical protein
MEKQKSVVLKSQASAKPLADTTNARNMSVAVRIRPLSTKEMNNNIPICCNSVGGGIVCIKKSGDSKANLKSQTDDSVYDFVFDNVFSEETQGQVYDSLVKPVVSSFLSGENGTVFAYGATGAGKSYTMLGHRYADPTQFTTTDEDNNRGIIHRALEDVLGNVDEKRRTGELGEVISLHLSFCEIYNDQVQDLLAIPTQSSSILPQPKYLQLREDAERGVVEVAGLSERNVESVDDAITAIAQGTALRRTDATGVNLVSSRSHAIIQLQLRHLRRSVDGRERMVESRFTFVDLAGSERASATHNRGMRLHEGANINKSLLALGNCINALSENRHVKYRDSKLTLFLKPSLEGNCNLVMIANINPALTCYEDSLHTLSYAARAKNIKIRPEVRERLLESTSVERECRLREENSRLKQRIEQLELECQRLRASETNLKAAVDDLESNSKQSRRQSRLSFGFVGRGSRDRSSNGSRAGINSGTQSSRLSTSSRHSKKSEPQILEEDAVIVQLAGEETHDATDNSSNEGDLAVSGEPDDNASDISSAADEDKPPVHSKPALIETGGRPRKQPSQRRGMWGWFVCGSNADVR